MKTCTNTRLSKFAMFALFSLLGMNPAAAQLNIVLNYEWDKNEPYAADPELPGNQAPAGLGSIFAYAESYYQDIFEGPAHTLTVNYWYDDLNPGTHGLHSAGADRMGNTVDAVGREIVANIRVDNRTDTNELPWFIDPTPQDDAEYSMTQTLWRDLSVNERNDWYNYGTNIPETFEVGYGGTASDPSSLAATRFDMLSLVLHEVGHALGLNSTGLRQTETNDDLDYDFNADFVFGSSLAAEVLSATNQAHLDSEYAVMDNNPYSFPGDGGPPNIGKRKRPSHTDLFAMASVNQYDELDIPRREFYGGNDWHVDGNWSGNAIPGSADMAFVRHGGFVALSANATVNSLVVDEQTQLATSTHRLTAMDSVSVQNDSVSGTTLLSVSNSGELVTSTLSIGDASRLFVGGHVDADNIEVGSGGEITGTGAIDISNGLGVLTNNGRIAALFDGVLTIDSDNNIGLDLDGGGLGIIEAIDGDMILDAGLTDEFNSTATVGAGRTMTFHGGVSIGAGGLLALEGGPTNGATVGGIVSVDQNGVVRGDGRSIVAATLTLNSGAIAETSDANTELRFHGFTRFAGGTVLGTGTVLQSGDAQVSNDTTISVATYDMDGQHGNSTIDVLDGRSLRIESASIESTGGGDGYDGTLNIHNGTVDIVSPWVLEGTVNLHDIGAGTAELAGAGVLTVAGGQINFHGGTGSIHSPVAVHSGMVFVDADATMHGPTTLGAHATIDINDGQDSLRLRGDTTLVGPTIVGNGRLEFDGNVNVAFLDTTIATTETDLDGVLGNSEITIQSGVTFSVASNTIEPTNNDGFDGMINNAGTFSVLAGWRLDGVLNMDPIGANTAVLDGVGSFEVHTSGLVNARDNVVINPDTNVAGTVNVTASRTRLNGNASFVATAHVHVTASSEMELNGATELNGGNYTGPGTLSFNGPVTVNTATTIDVAETNLDGDGATQVHLHDQLTLNVDRVDQADNRFDGTVDMQGNSASLVVNLSDPTDRWVMNGVLSTTGASGFFYQTTLQGSPVEVTGSMLMDGLSAISAPMDFAGVMTTADASTIVRLNGGPHVVRSSSLLTGPGELRVGATAHLLLEDAAFVQLDVLNGGRVEPGTSIGTVTLADSYEQSSIGTLAMEIAGPPTGAHDLLQVYGVANIDGELEVAAVGEYVPTVGQRYTLLTANAVAGTFSMLTLRSDSIFEFDATLLYPGTRVVMEITDVSMFGDFNDDLALNCADVDALVVQIADGAPDIGFDLTGDGVVDTGDLDEWLSVAGTFNVGGPYLAGDANLDGLVDLSDLNIWNAHKFTSDTGWCGGDFNADGLTDVSDLGIWNRHKFTSSTGLLAVPEPGALVLLLCALTLFARRASRSYSGLEAAFLTNL